MTWGGCWISQSDGADVTAAEPGWEPAAAAGGCTAELASNTARTPPKNATAMLFRRCFHRRAERGLWAAAISFFVIGYLPDVQPPQRRHSDRLIHLIYKQLLN